MGMLPLAYGIISPAARGAIPKLNSRYRPDIDGLRAVAVIAVIINHFNKNILASGYLGVDIFFVISGYVITTSLRNHTATGWGDFLLGFYARRLKRILPALLVMVLVSSFAICLVDPNPGTSLQTGITSIFGFSNIYLVYRLTDYFAASAELNIFLHTWSLGIEEQFYFLFPLLAWWSGYGRQARAGLKQLALVLIPLFVISLITFILVYPRSQPHAYFLINSRFWELASGCLLSLLGQSRTSKIIWKPAPLLLFGALIGVLFLPLQQAVTATLLCILLTCLLIFSLEPNGLAYRLLSWNPIVSIGLISYSLYLWHWPVLTLSRWTVGIQPETIPFQVGLIWLMAWLSYRFVETPLRHATWPKRRSLTLLLSLLAALGSSALLILLGKNWNSNLFLGQRNNLEENYASLSSKSTPICNLFTDPKKVATFPDGCGSNVDKNDKTPAVYILGDSQIEQFAPAISSYAVEHNFSVHGIWGNACAFPALSGIKAPKFDAILPPCQTAQGTLEEKMKSVVKPGDIIFIGSYLTTYYGRTTEVVSGTLDLTRQAYLEKLIALAETLIARGASVVIYLNGPRFDGLEGAIDGYCYPQWFKPKTDANCENPSVSFLADRAKFFEPLNRWSDGARRFVLDGVHPTTCSAGVCKATHYKDEAHFREYYSNYIFHEFSKQNPTLFSPHSALPRSSKGN